MKFDNIQMHIRRFSSARQQSSREERPSNENSLRNISRADRCVGNKLAPSLRGSIFVLFSPPSIPPTRTVETVR